MATLELYLIRHGVAADRGDDYPDDSKRPLTSKGISALKKEARALAALGVDFDQILASPLVRTRQTAEVFAQLLPSSPPVALSDALAPAGAPAAVFQELAKHMRKGRLARRPEPNIGDWPRGCAVACRSLQKGRSSGRLETSRPRVRQPALVPAAANVRRY